MCELYKKMKLSLFIRLSKNEIMRNLMQNTLIIIQTEKERESIVREVFDLIGLQRHLESEEYEIDDIDDLVSLAGLKIREIENINSAEYKSNHRINKLKELLNKTNANTEINELLLPPTINNNLNN